MKIAHVCEIRLVHKAGTRRGHLPCVRVPTAVEPVTEIERAPVVQEHRRAVQARTRGLPTLPDGAAVATLGTTRHNATVNTRTALFMPAP